ncbi:terminase TerL endonuclease subunit [Sinorhizobium medicae]
MAGQSMAGWICRPAPTSPPSSWRSRTTRATSTSSRASGRLAIRSTNVAYATIHLVPRIWTPGDTLDERGLRDRAPYRVWADNGFLIPVPGQVLDYDFLAADVGELSSTIPFANVNYDMWRIDVLKQSFARLGVDVPLSPFGQGYKSMSPAIEAFEELAVQGKLFHGGHPVLRWCISNAVIDSDAAGNRKLTKANSLNWIWPTWSPENRRFACQ